MGKLGALEHGARMTVLCVNTQRQEPCCSVAFLKVSLIGAENKGGDTACLRRKQAVSRLTSFKRRFMRALSKLCDHSS